MEIFFFLSNINQSNQCVYSRSIRWHPEVNTSWAHYSNPFQSLGQQKTAPLPTSSGDNGGKQPNQTTWNSKDCHSKKTTDNSPTLLSPCDVEPPVWHKAAAAAKQTKSWLPQWLLCIGKRKKWKSEEKTHIGFYLLHLPQYEVKYSQDQGF